MDPSPSVPRHPVSRRRARSSPVRRLAARIQRVPVVGRIVRPSRNLYRRVFTPLRPPVELEQPRGDPARMGKRWVSTLADLGGLGPGDRALDVGCGSGRIAIPLTSYLSPRGEYHGFDVQRPHIEWCREAISGRFPNFHFEVADLYNPFYNPEGRWHAEEYRFPFEDVSFDLVFLASVFTHMRPPEVRRYLGEICRVLRDGKRCVATFFLLNEESKRLIAEGRASRDFRHEMGGYHTINPERPEDAIAYDEADVRGMYAEAGLRIVEIRYGLWSGRAPHFMGQDVVVGEKDSR